MTDGSLGAARAALHAGASCRDILHGHLARLTQSEPAIHAWVTVDRAGAEERAAALDATGGSPGPLQGIPIGIKDIIDVAGLPTAAGSQVTDHSPAAADAPVVARLREAGATILGKTATQEFAYGAVTPGTNNPGDASRIPGGSSGGSAAALAAGHCLGAVGTDTAGSIRIPAALCGVVGLKPRPGILPLEGIIPLAPSFDVVGPMARSVADVTVLWEVLSGRSVGADPVDRLWVAVTPLEYLPDLQPEVAVAYFAALNTLARLTRPPVRAEIPAFGAFDQPRSRILMWEALQVHRSRDWWPARASFYTEETRGYLAFAEEHLDEALVTQARAECAELSAGLRAILEHTDVLVSPTVPIVAPTHAEAARRAEGSPRRPVVMELTRIPGPVNVAGLAALSLPCGTGAGGLPVGLQLIGRDEGVLLRLGAAFEQAAGA